MTDPSAAIPGYLTNLPRWLFWRTVTVTDKKTRKKRATKAPFAYRDGRKPCDAHDPQNWTDYASVAAALIRAPGAWDGPGFDLGVIEALAEVIIGLDLDTCLNADGALATWAIPFMLAMHSYSEVSPSGTGIKIFGRLRLADLPEARRLLQIPDGDRDQARTIAFGERSNGQHAPGAQLFLMRRYFAVTGKHWVTAPEDVALLTLKQIAELAALFGPKPAAGKQRTDGCAPEADDDEAPDEAALTEKLNNELAANAKLRERWAGGTEGLIDTTRSGFDMSIVALLRRASFTKGEVYAALHRFEHGKIKEERPRYFGEMWRRTKATPPPAPPADWEAAHPGPDGASDSLSSRPSPEPQPGEGGGPPPPDGEDGPEPQPGGGGGPPPPPDGEDGPEPQPGGGGGPPPPPDGEDGPEPQPGGGGGPPPPPDGEGRADGARLDEPAEVPAIYCIAGKLPRMVREAEAALLKAGKAVYQRGVLVRPVEVEYPAADGRQTHSAALATITPPAMLKMLAEVAIWLKWDGRRRAWVDCNPPGDVVHILLASRGDWRFPVIRGVITCPSLRPDGSLLTKPGYDEQSRYYLMLPTGLTLPAIPNRPSRAEALAALARLDGLLDGFSFVDDGGVSRAVALAILLTQVLRVAMTVSPLLTVSATTPGTGKSFLIDLAAAIASGRFCPVVPPGRNEEETEKGIRTKLVSSSPAFSIDNVYTMPNLPVLNQATERPLISIRQFGVLEEIEVENAVTIYMTGNNLAIIGEQNRRTLQCKMDAGVERPERRKFPLGNPIETVMADRGRYIADILIIARAYLTSNGPPPDLDPLGSYEAWSRLVREPLVWLGQPDPVLSQETTRQNDPETIRLNAIITAWHVAFVMEPRTLAQAAQFATTPPTYPGEHADADVLHAYNAHRAAQEQLLTALREAFPAARDGIDTSRWGYWMRRVAGVIAGGLRFIKDPGHTEGTVRWKLAKAPGAK